MTTTSPTIFIAMPVFQGWEHVTEAVTSIKSQTYGNYRVLISVDGADRRSYDACKRCADDPRFEIVLQQSRLGWAGNMDWLAAHLDEDYFCYWQHDDYCDPDYLKILVEYADRHPEAASVYCDIQHFGTRNHIVRARSSTGFALERVLRQAERYNPAVIRCLNRAAAMKLAVPITSASTWAFAIARAGELHRVPKILYFRRNRPDSLNMQMLSAPQSEMLASTLDWGLGFLQHAHPLVQRHEIGRLMATIADMLVNRQIRGRWQFDFAASDSKVRKEFVSNLLVRGVAQFGFEQSCADEALDYLERIEEGRSAGVPSDDPRDQNADISKPPRSRKVRGWLQSVVANRRR